MELAASAKPARESSQRTDRGSAWPTVTCLLTRLMTGAKPFTPGDSWIRENETTIRAVYWLFQEPENGRSPVLFFGETVGRLLRQLSSKIEREKVASRSRITGKILWSHTWSGRLTQDYDPLLFVCNRAKRCFSTPENELFKHVVLRVGEQLRLVPPCLRHGIAVHPAGEEGKDDEIARLVGRMETTYHQFLRHKATQEIDLLGEVSPLHVAKTKSSKMVEYRRVAQIHDDLQVSANRPALDLALELGRRALLLPAELSIESRPWVRLAATILQASPGAVRNSPLGLGS